MRSSWWAARSRTVLLVVAGVLLVPTIALGARLVSSWQSGSVIVRKLGPLPTISWQPSAADLVDGIYSLRRPLEMSPPSLPGTTTSQASLRYRIDIPESFTDSLAAAIAGKPESMCYVSIGWGIAEGAGWYMTEFGGASSTEIGALAGVREGTSVTDDPNIAGKLGQMEVFADVTCFSNNETVPVSFTGPGLSITPTSIRVLAY